MSKRVVAPMRTIAAFLVGAIGISCEHAGSDAEYQESANDILRRAANELRDKGRWTTKTGTEIVARLQYIVASAHSGDAEAVNLIEAEPGAGLQIWPSPSSGADHEGPIRAETGVMRINGSVLEITLSKACFEFLSGTVQSDGVVVKLGKVDEL